MNLGLNVRVLDFDCNTHPIKSYSDQEKFEKHFSSVRCVDSFTTDAAGNIRLDGSPKALSTAMGALNAWPDGSKSSDWGVDDVLVVDSGSVMAEAALRRSMALNGRLGKKPHFGDYENAHALTENFLLHIKSHLPCHFIYITHLFLMGPDFSAGDIDDDALAEKIIEKKLEGAEHVPWKLAPKTVGKKMHDMAKHFSGVIYCTTRGSQRKLVLRPMDGIDAGVPIKGLPSELNIEDGLAKIFQTKGD